jgi:hypothetical protein
VTPISFFGAWATVFDGNCEPFRSKTVWISRKDATVRAKCVNAAALTLPGLIQ